MAVHKSRQPKLKVVAPQNAGAAQLETGTSAPDLPDEVIDDLVVEAQNLPNIDDRPSILGDDLPQGLLVEGRKSFAIPEAQRAAGIRVANPRMNEWVRSRPGPDWSAVMYAIKDGSTGITHPLLPLLLQEIPQLAFQAKLWDFRMAVTTKKQPYLWPVPIGGLRLTPSDQALREAQEASCEQWVTVWFDGVSWQHRRPLIDGGEELPEAQFPDEPFSKYLARAIKKLVIINREHPVIRGIIRPT
jgi:hypothetical protein